MSIRRNVGKPEERFTEGSGERYMKDGRIRCHGMARSRVRAWREEHQDWDTPTDDLWPEMQCHMAAEEGFFVCRLHGGKTPTTVAPPRTMIDAMPVDLANKFRVIMENPDYISRKEQIVLAQARQWELLEELKQTAGSEEAWGMVHEAYVLLKKGEDIQAKLMLEDALDHTKRHREVWEEVYRTDKVLVDLTNTQVKTAKEMRQMATTEQILRLMQGIENVVIAAGKQYIKDEKQRNEFIRDVGHELGRFINFRPQTVIEQLIGAGPTED